MNALYGGFQGLRRLQSDRRPRHPDHHRSHRPGPPNQQSAVPKPTSWDPELNYSRTWAGILSKPVTSSCWFTPRFWTPTRSMARTRIAERSASPPARNWARPPVAQCRATRPATACGFHVRPSHQINLGSYAVINLRQYVHSLYLQTTIGWREADAKRRAAVGVRVAAV